MVFVQKFQPKRKKKGEDDRPAYDYDGEWDDFFDGHTDGVDRDIGLLAVNSENYNEPEKQEEEQQEQEEEEEEEPEYEYEDEQEDEDYPQEVLYSSL